MQGTCPFHEPQRLPIYGTPLSPSPRLAAWRDHADAVPLEYQDGHEGLVVTGYETAREVLADPRFRQLPHRIPAADSLPPHPAPMSSEGQQHESLDQNAQSSIEAANLLALDGAEHSRMRRAITARYSVKQARLRAPWVSRMVDDQFDRMVAKGSPVDLNEHYAEPISVLTHCHVLGVPDGLVPEFGELFVHGASVQEKFDHIRRVIDARANDPGEDVISDLLARDLTPIEVEGLVFQIMSAGRDSVAYLIVTATVALLTNPNQLERIQRDPTLLSGALEEFLRTGTMFLTLFPRTAVEDVRIGDVFVSKGQSVSVSPVAANRDPRRFEDPEYLDVGRNAFGHLGFGHGPHSCVGQQLARVEIREAVLKLLTALQNLRLVDAEQLRPLPFANPIATYAAGAAFVEWDQVLGSKPLAPGFQP